MSFDRFRQSSKFIRILTNFIKKATILKSLFEINFNFGIVRKRISSNRNLHEKKQLDRQLNRKKSRS